MTERLRKLNIVSETYSIPPSMADMYIVGVPVREERKRHKEDLENGQTQFDEKHYTAKSLIKLQVVWHSIVKLLRESDLSSTEILRKMNS